MITLNQFKVLASIEKGNNYGYLISKETGLPLGGIYNTLSSLWVKGLLKTSQSKQRSLYFLTEDGEEMIRKFRRETST